MDVLKRRIEKTPKAGLWIRSMVLIMVWGTAQGQSVEPEQPRVENKSERIGISETIRLVEDRATTLEIPGIVERSSGPASSAWPGVS